MKRWILLLFAAIAVFVGSCTKDGIDRYSFTFTAEGGPLLYELDINGATISLESSGVEADKPVFIESYGNPDDGQWFTELDWIRVYYMPFTETLYISADKNLSGRSRKALIKCSGNATAVRIDIRQK